MPNDLTNIMKIKGTNPKSVLDSIIGKDDQFDFNLIHPMPKELEGTSAPSTKPNWYDWCIENWGTKWGAYDTDINGDDCISFHTAWSMPENLMVKLSLKFPDYTFIIDWADEDFGYNTGQATFKAGKIISEVVPESGSTEAYENAFDVMPEYRDDYTLVEGEYLHNSEIEGMLDD